MSDEQNKKTLYELYRLLNESEIPLFKKKAVLRSLFIGESWTWVVTEISREALKQLKADGFKKLPHKFDRHHPIPFKKTAEQMLVTSTLPYKAWCRIIKKNEKVYLITKDEHRKWNKEQPEMIPIAKQGLFNNGGRTVGFSYGEDEIEYLKMLDVDT